LLKPIDEFQAGFLMIFGDENTGFLRLTEKLYNYKSGY